MRIASANFYSDTGLANYDGILQHYGNLDQHVVVREKHQAAGNPAADLALSLD